MGRFFNTSGPNMPRIHYTLDPMSRLTRVRALIDDEKYFILHAPRQTGKTTTMIAFMEALNAEDKYIALYINVEPAQAVRNKVKAANGVFLSVIDSQIRIHLQREYWPSPECYKVPNKEDGLRTFLSRWCAELPKPLVLFIDEADALIGDSLLSLLRQLRNGYSERPSNFPHSVALIGLRDIRDYRIYSENAKRYEIGGSAFNIRDESLTMSNFTAEQVCALYAIHTAETGQQFTEDALNFIFEQTQGQPWLVNAIGRELCFNEHKVPDLRTIVVEDVQKAVDILILRRDTHLDHLSDKLTEPRVARVLDFIMGGSSHENTAEAIPSDDLKYLIDLGLVARTPKGLGIANPIYREVIPRELTSVQQDILTVESAWFVKPNGKLDIEKVLAYFIEFYKENGEIVTNRKLYTESAHHLIFMAWLQRIVNGGGYIRREYAAGLGFIDLMIFFSGEKFVFELKVEGSYKREKALNQVCQYAKRMGVQSCYLLVFRRKATDVDAIGIRETVLHDGLTVHLIWL